jgi:hypothetical protein
VSAVAILLIVCVIAAVSLLAGTDPSNDIITTTGRVVAFNNPFDSRLVSFQRHVEPSQESVFSAVKDFFGMPIYVFSLHSLGVKNPTSFAEGGTGFKSYSFFFQFVIVILLLHPSTYCCTALSTCAPSSPSN